jgi:hypothetical protein
MNACVRLMPGHHPTRLSLGPDPIPSQNHRPTLAPIQSRHRQILIVHGHVQENGMRGVGGHEDAASHANYLAIETAVTTQVPGIDASAIRAQRRCYLHLSCLRVSCIVYARYSIPYTTLCTTSVEPFVEATMSQTEVGL